MASSVNEHISAAERTKWDEAVATLTTHINNKNIHIPTPPSDGKNYYLGNDLKWHRVPIATVIY